ncbi:MAG: Nre family DNA repair protein [Candidatus Diapherotrites archaeon]|nr:Nre family DNA repair protein [Candidatus Diapherotrites archaeon]
MLEKNLCLRCKGKMFCGLGYCPLLTSYSAKAKATAFSGELFRGASPPSVFVSWQNYPKVTVSPLSTNISEDVSFFDSPEKWYGLSAERIIEMRSSLLMAGKKFYVYSAQKPAQDLQAIQELVMSSSDVSVELTLEKKPGAELSFCNFFGPIGPKATLQKIKLVENPKIDRKVDYLVHDYDASAIEVIMELYEKGFNTSFLQKLLNIGLLGRGNKRKIVPTRWAITAVDSNVSKKLIENYVKEYEKIDLYEVYNSFYLDNDFWVLLLPEKWSFEQLECWLPGSVWMQKEKEHHIIQDHELYNGRKNYAENVEGAYYAARLAVAEHLTKRKKQAACIVFREISEKYAVPLGVWQIRENVRYALKQKPVCFCTLDDAIAFLSGKLKIPIEQYLKASELIKHFKKQKKIAQWFDKN